METRVHAQHTSSWSLEDEELKTNLEEGLCPDAGAHFEDGSGPLLQQTHVALEHPALGIRAGLQEHRGRSQDNVHLMPMLFLFKSSLFLNL